MTCVQKRETTIFFYRPNMTDKSYSVLLIYYCHIGLDSTENT